jgi:hypothetical protein
LPSKRKRTEGNGAPTGTLNTGKISLINLRIEIKETKI